jgi:predicted RNase H-like HicB family nuclease
MIQVSYTSQLFNEEGQIVSVCPELNVSSFGDTAEEASACLREAVSLFLEECHRMGTLEMVLKNLDTVANPRFPIVGLLDILQH